MYLPLNIDILCNKSYHKAIVFYFGFMVVISKTSSNLFDLKCCLECLTFITANLDTWITDERR